MSSSSDFQTSGVVLMVATLVCAVGGAIIIAPRLQPEVIPVPVKETGPATLNRYAEFYPAQGREMPGTTPLMPPKTQRAHNEHVASYSRDSKSQAVTSHQTQTTRATLTSHSIPSASGNLLPPGKSDVNRLPTGSVYAPVTVHPVTVTVDSSQVADRMQSIERQLRQLTETTQTKRTAAENRRPGGQRRRRRSKTTETVRTEAMDGRLQHVTTELHALASSVRALQQDTHANLSELTRHQQQMNQNSHETFLRWQSVLDNKLRAQELAVRTVIASRPREQPHSSASNSDELAGDWVIRESVPHQMPSHEPEGPPPGPPVIHQPPASHIPPQPADAVPTSLSLTTSDELAGSGQPASPTTEAPVTSVSPPAVPLPSSSLGFASNDEIEQSPEPALVQQRESLPVIPALGEPVPQTTPPPTEVSETRLKAAADAAESWEDVFPPAEIKQTARQHDERQHDELQMGVLTEDEFDALPVLEMEALPDLPEEPADSPQTLTSRAVEGSDAHKRRIVSPVAFEHVYRFEMSEAEPAPARTVIERTSVRQTTDPHTDHSQQVHSATVLRPESPTTPAIEEPYVPFSDEAQETQKRQPVRYGNPRTVRKQKDARGTLLPKLSFPRLSSSMRSIGQRSAN